MANASAAGPPPVSSSPHSFGALGSTFGHFRPQPSLQPRAPQPDQLESAAVQFGGAQATSTSSSSNGRGVSTSATSDDGDGDDPSRGGGGARDSLSDIADKLSAWPSEKVEKVKHLRDQFLSKD